MPKSKIGLDKNGLNYTSYSFKSKHLVLNLNQSIIVLNLNQSIIVTSFKSKLNQISN